MLMSGTRRLTPAGTPGPESSTETLRTYQRSFKNKPITPDVYLIDVVWPKVLSEHLADLGPALGEDSKVLLDATVKNDTVDGRLVAIPFFVETGVLYYRTDLLGKYGYKHPPETWDELEQMAAKIQRGERAAGNPHFWGYVWQGAAYEGLTCDAMEWQMSEGGGRIIEEDGTISVNNPDTVRAQVEGAVIFGITAALYGEITLQDGRVEQANLDTYQILRLDEAPVIDVYIVNSAEAPGGMGEAGTSAIVPAVANAIFAATGKRLRRMPIDTAGLKRPV